MARKQLTKEEVAELEKNPSIAKATVSTISFTPEFKRIAYQQLVDGRSLREILKEIGVNPDVLGESRLWGIAARMRRDAEREEGYADLRERNRRRFANEAPERTEKEELKALRHEVAYMRQEI